MAAPQHLTTYRAKGSDLMRDAGIALQIKSGSKTAIRVRDIM